MAARHHLRNPVILFFLCVLLFLFIPIIRRPFNPFDEGIAVLNATRIMHGEIPYKDFWTVYPAGQFYMLDILFRIFGTTLLVARIYDTLLRFVMVISLYFITAKITTRTLALVVCILVTILLTTIGFYVYAVFPALTFGLLAILSTIAYLGTERQRWLWGSGLLIGLSTLFRWDIGGYVGISIVPAIFLFHYIHTAGLSKSILAAIRSLITVVAGVLLVALPCYGYWGLRGGFADLADQVVVFHLTILHSVRWKPYPGIIPSFSPSETTPSGIFESYIVLLDWLRFYLPVVIYGVIVVDYVAAYARKRATYDTAHFSLMMVTILGILLFNQALSRFDYIHVLPSTLIVTLPAVLVVDRLLRSVQKPVVRKPLVTLLTIFAFLYFFLPITTLFYSSPFRCHSHLDRTSCVALDTDQEQAVDYIREHTRAGEPIFVGNLRHDLIRINDVGFYFLADRPSATRYTELVPGVATTRAVQEDMVEDIESKKVNYVVLVDMPESDEPNDSSVSSGVFLLDEFIRAHYTPVAEFGDYEIWHTIDLHTQIE